MNPSKILYVIGSLNIGGTENHLLNVLPQLNRKRWTPIVYCLSERGALAQGLEDRGVRVICYDGARPAASMSRLRRAMLIAVSFINLINVMRRLRPQIAHFFLPAAYILGASAAIVARVPIRIMSRRSLNDYQRGKWLSGAIERMLHGHMTAILGNSRRVIFQLRDEENVAPERLGLIYNGIEMTPFDRPIRIDDLRQMLGLGPETLTFAIVANLIPYKGHRDLVDAFGLASARLPANWRLLVIGRDDGIERQLHAQAESLGIRKNVLFLGLRHDVSAILNVADVCLLSSHQEGFSNAILEYMAAGRPTIATDVGGNSEAVVDGETGLIVPPHNSARLAEAILKISSNSNLRLSMGTKALARVNARFSLARCVSSYEEVYAALIAKRSICEVESARVA